jgi:hypothetical protein
MAVTAGRPPFRLASGITLVQALQEDAMTILRAHATPLAAALCLVLAAPAATHAAGYMYFKDTPVVGELPTAPSLATPTQPRAPSAVDTDGRDFLMWQRQYGTSAVPKTGRPGGLQKVPAPGSMKAK